ncbi:MAG: hypothetical protein V1753_04075 [Pseudomonadota bacterium]
MNRKKANYKAKDKIFVESKDIIVFILGLVTGLSVNTVSHIFTKIRDKKNNFLNITDSLRNPFAEAKSLFSLQTNGIPRDYIIGDVFNRLYTDQSKSIEAIMPYITIAQGERLRNIWEEYCDQINKKGISTWFDCENFYENSEGVIEKREKAIKQLDLILFFFDYHNMFSIFRILKRWHK